MDDERTDNSSYYVDKPTINRKPPRKKGNFLSYFIIALIAALVGGVIGSYIGPNYLYGNIIPVPDIYKGQTPYTQHQKVNITPKDDMNTVSAVYKKAQKSIVGITTVEVVRDFFWEREIEGLGSGIIVDPNGYILTNSHVVGDGKAKKITVLFENGDKKAASVLWCDPTLDLAIVKVKATGLPVAELGDSDKLTIGESAIAIGNPLGLEFQRTVTSGVISGLNRSIKVDDYNIIDNLIQTDATINPGNSGGALLNSKGEVIGINTVKITSGEGLGFAIPINVAKPIVEQVLKEGSFKNVIIGIQGTEVERYEAYFDIDLDAKGGVIVLKVEPNSPASNAGLKSGDVILKLDNKEIENMSQMKKMLYNYKKGDKATLTIVRNGETRELDVVFSKTK